MHRLILSGADVSRVATTSLTRDRLRSRMTPSSSSSYSYSSSKASVPDFEDEDQPSLCELRRGKRGPFSRCRGITEDGDEDDTRPSVFDRPNKAVVTR